MSEKLKKLQHELNEEYKSIAEAHRDRRNTVINNTEAIEELFVSQKNVIRILAEFMKEEN